MNEVQATTAQLNQAARIAAARGIDFEAALTQVLTDPNAGAGLPVVSSGASVGDVASVFERGAALGRAQLLREQQEAANQERLTKLETAQGALSADFGRVKSSAQVLAVGLSDHLSQHAGVAAKQLEAIDARSTAQLMLEAARSLGLDDVALEMQATIDALPEPKAAVLEPEAKGGRR